jgi:GT2 family glycosyltransferase
VDLSIIIVNWNTRDLLQRCIESVYQTAADIEFEVLVVDNHSLDGSAEMVASTFPQVELIRNNENVGFARANNQAIRVSRGRFVLLLNSDAALLPATARSMLDVFEQEPRVGVVGAQLLNPDGTFQGSYADFPSLPGELLLASRVASIVYGPSYPSYPVHRSQRDRLVDWVSGACLMVRREAMAGVGLLDEDYFMYTEETDWCYRMKQSGWLVYYCAGARVLHWASQSSKRVPERRRGMVYRSKWLFMRKHRGPLAAALFRYALWTVSLLKLGMWQLRGLLGGDLADQHVQSYRVVLRELGRAFT